MNSPGRHVLIVAYTALTVALFFLIDHEFAYAGAFFPLRSHLDELLKSEARTGPSALISSDALSLLKQVTVEDLEGFESDEFRPIDIEYFMFGDYLIPVSTFEEAGGMYWIPWPNRKIFYTFDASVTDPLQRERWISATLYWQQSTNLEFVNVSNSDAAALTYCISVGQKGGSQSYSLGLGAGKYGVWLAGPAWSTSILHHEIAHVVGLIHEHQRSDSRLYIDVTDDHDNVCESFETTVNVTSYDFESITHYSSLQRSHCNMRPKSNYSHHEPSMGRSTRPTARDLQAIAHAY